MKVWLTILPSLCAILALTCPSAALPASELASADGQLLTEVHDHNELMKNIEYLSDIIGPRLTGSPQQRAASDWAEQQFRRYGLVNVHQEKWTISHSWTRGSAEAGITAPISRRVAIVSAGWSPSTGGSVQGPVVYVSAKSASELEAYRSKLAGAIVILAEPEPITPPYAIGHPAVQLTDPDESHSFVVDVARPRDRGPESLGDP